MIFRPELAIAILRGEKTATRRAIVPGDRAMWRELEPWRYPVGKVFAVQPGRGADRVADARVTRRALEPLSTVKPQDARREGFATRDAFVETWIAINGAWDPDQRVHVVEFEITTPACSECGGAGSWSDWNGEEGGAGPCGACLETGLTLNDAARQLLERTADTG